LRRHRRRLLLLLRQPLLPPPILNLTQLMKPLVEIFVRERLVGVRLVADVIPHQENEREFQVNREAVAVVFDFFDFKVGIRPIKVVW
jgi:hypothetical protein